MPIRYKEKDFDYQAAYLTLDNTMRAVVKKLNDDPRNQEPKVVAKTIARVMEHTAQELRKSGHKTPSYD